MSVSLALFAYTLVGVVHKGHLHGCGVGQVGHLWTGYRSFADVRNAAKNAQTLLKTARKSAENRPRNARKRQRGEGLAKWDSCGRGGVKMRMSFMDNPLGVGVCRLPHTRQ